MSAVPHTNKIIKELAGQPIQFIAITDEDPELIKTFISKRTFSSWVGIDSDGSTLEDYEISSRPEVVVIDRKGRIVFRGLPRHLSVELLTEIIDGTYQPSDSGLTSLPETDTGH